MPGPLKPPTLIFILMLALAPIALATPAHAQPTWSFRVEVLPAKLYMGEWNQLYVNITNMDCNMRTYHVLELKSASEKYVEAVIARAREMRSRGLIGNYSLAVGNMWGSGGNVYGDYTLELYDVCGGRSIEVTGAGVWFPIRGIGRDITFIFWNNTGFTLEAFDPIAYILNGSHPKSSKLLSFRVYVPEDIPPDQLSAKPAIDIRVNYPGWIEYTFESYRVEVNNAEIQPYRSFRLTVTDYDGLSPVPGARVVIRRLMHYYDVKEYITPENGTIRIYRLQDGDYEVTVYWNATRYRQDYPHIHHEQHSAWSLASSKALRTSLFNVRVRALDAKGAPLDGAKVVLDSVEAAAKGGEAAFSMVPQANHSIQVSWRGVKLYEGWIWAGYHPTIHPYKPAVQYELSLPVADLVVEAVDTGGNRLPANFTVIGPTPEASLNISSESGLLNASQMPAGEYRVRAASTIKPFNKAVYSEAVFRPGEPGRLIMPVHPLTVIARDAGGRPLKGADIRLGPLNRTAGEDGSAVFPGVPEGEYGLEVRWLGIVVYSRRIAVSGPAKVEANASVYDISLRFVTGDGRQARADYTFIDPLGREFRGELAEGLKLEDIPDGICNITVRDHEAGRILYASKPMTYELAGMRELRLPIADMVIAISWPDGRPLEGARVIVLDAGSGRKFEGQTDGNGRAIFRDMIYSSYKVFVYYPRTSLLIHSMEAAFAGQEVRVTLREAIVSVRVLDAWGKPLRGAEIWVYYEDIPLANGYTDGSGMAELKVLERPSYRVSARYEAYRAEATVKPGGLAEIRLGSPGLPIPGAEISIGGIPLIYAIAALAALIIIAAIILRVRRPRGRAPEDMLWEEG